MYSHARSSGLVDVHTISDCARTERRIITNLLITPCVHIGTTPRAHKYIYNYELKAFVINLRINRRGRGDALAVSRRGPTNRNRAVVVDFIVVRPDVKKRTSRVTRGVFRSSSFVLRAVGFSSDDILLALFDTDKCVFAVALTPREKTSVDFALPRRSSRSAGLTFVISLVSQIILVTAVTLVTTGTLVSASLSLLLTVLTRSF